MAPVPVSQRKQLQLQCEWANCTEVFETIQLFTNHLMTHAEEFIVGALSIEKCLADVDENDMDEYQCQWEDCGYVTTEGSGALLRHLLFHGYHTRIKWVGTVERERCKLEPCQLESHCRNIIPEVPSSFVCSWDDCTFITNNPDFFYCHVEMHSQMAEVQNKLFRCKWRECNIKTKDKYKLRDHLRSHSQEKKFGCSQCGGLFSNRTKFFDHIHRQSLMGEPNYQCSHCSKVFASERLLRDHMRHHVNHYKCPLCDMTCPAPSLLKKHIQWRHSSERPYKCDQCEHSAKSMADLRRHLESHNADDAYSCDIEDCTYTAKTLHGMKSHFKKAHSGENVKRYMCHVCQTMFTRGNRLTNHLKEKHRFKWPSGHVRFRYQEHEDGFLRLQTVRYESIELTQQLLQGPRPSLPCATIQEEAPPGGQAGARQPPLGGSERGKVGKMSKKRSSPRKKSPKKKSPKKSIAATADLQPMTSELHPGQIQYVQDEHGQVLVVDCTADMPSFSVTDGAQRVESNKTSGDVVYRLQYMGEDVPPHGSDEGGIDLGYSHSKRKHCDDRVEGEEVITAANGFLQAQQLLVDKFSETSVGTTSEGRMPVAGAEANFHLPQEFDLQRLCRCVQHKAVSPAMPTSPCKQCGGIATGISVGSHSLSDDRITVRDSLPMSTFPIEQLQVIDDGGSSDRDSCGERTPKKARYEFMHVVPEEGATLNGITDDERMRNLYPRLEDDRMAMAVEAMTNLSRGFGTAS